MIHLSIGILFLSGYFLLKLASLISDWAGLVRTLDVVISKEIGSDITAGLKWIYGTKLVLAVYTTAPFSFSEKSCTIVGVLVNSK